MSTNPRSKQAIQVTFGDEVNGQLAEVGYHTFLDASGATLRALLLRLGIVK